MSRKSRRVRKLEAEGKATVPCHRCPRVFANIKDRNRHFLDAHTGASRERDTSVKITHQGSHTTTSVTRREEPTRLLTMGGNKVVMLVDYVTPHPSLECPECHKFEAIPLINKCAICELAFLTKRYPKLKPAVDITKPGAAAAEETTTTADGKFAIRGSGNHISETTTKDDARDEALEQRLAEAYGHGGYEMDYDNHFPMI